MLGENSAGGLTTVSGFLVSAGKPPITYLSPYRKKDPWQDTGGCFKA